MGSTWLLKKTSIKIWIIALIFRKMKSLLCTAMNAFCQHTQKRYYFQNMIPGIKYIMHDKFYFVQISFFWINIYNNNIFKHKEWLYRRGVVMWLIHGYSLCKERLSSAHWKGHRSQTFKEVIFQCTALICIRMWLSGRSKQILWLTSIHILCQV